MTQLIPADNGLEEVKRLQAPLMDGSLPDWLTLNEGDPDSVSVFDASDEGGYLQMAVEEGAELVSTFEIAPEYNVVELQTDIRFQDGSARQAVGFARSGQPADREELYYQHDAGSLWAKNEVTEARTATPRLTGGHVRRLRLLWYTDEGRAQLFFDGRAAAEVDVAPGLPCHVSIKAVDSTVDVRSLAVGYYRRSNAPLY